MRRVRVFQLHCALRDSLFEAFIQFANLKFGDFLSCDIAECRHAAAQHAALVDQWRSIRFNPYALLHFRDAHKHLCAAYLTGNSS